MRLLTVVAQRLAYAAILILRRAQDEGANTLYDPHAELVEA